MCASSTGRSFDWYGKILPQDDGAFYAIPDAKPVPTFAGIALTGLS
jgi:hypothetical protein